MWKSCHLIRLPLWLVASKVKQDKLCWNVTAQELQELMFVFIGSDI